AATDRQVRHGACRSLKKFSAMKYKLSALAGIDTSYRTAPGALKSAALVDVTKAFVGNVDRGVSMCVFPVRLLNLSGHFFGEWKRAENKLEKEMDVVRHREYDKYLEMRPAIVNECQAFTLETLAAIEGNNDTEKQRRWEEGLFFIDAMIEKSGDFLN